MARIRLTQSEFNFLSGWTGGWSMEEMAKEWNVENRWLNQFRKDLYRKLGVKTRKQFYQVAHDRMR